MTIQQKSLREIHKSIRDSVKKKLETDEKLSEIKRVVYGEKVKIGTLGTPAIWIVPEPWTPDLVGGQTENHDIRFNFVTLVKSSNPEEALEKAQDLALTVYEILMEDRSLDKLVTDVRPQRIDPAYEMGNNTQVCWSSVQFDFRLKRR